MRSGQRLRERCGPGSGDLDLQRPSVCIDKGTEMTEMEGDQGFIIMQTDTKK